MVARWLTFIEWAVLVVAYLTVVAILLSACTSTGDLCAVGPFQPAPEFEQRLTRGEKQQIYVWNRSGEDVCGWKAPR